MKIAIHKNKDSFALYWEAYCQRNNIPYKWVNCYDNDIIAQLADCTALMWHHKHSSSKDVVFARQLLFSLEQSGFTVFPDFNTGWHFDDKVGQKYLLEALKVPFVPSFVFYSKGEASEWIKQATFPKVFKLRGGAGSSNVRLVKSKNEALKLAGIAFGKGFKQYDAWDNLMERWRRFRLGQVKTYEVLKGIARLFYEPRFSKTMGREKGYLYFQEFMPANDSDTRIIVIEGKAFALKRMVRENDFRASGSGTFKFHRSEFDERCVQISFETTRKMKAQCVAFDFVFDPAGNPLIVEVSYGFGLGVYDKCPGYWDEKLTWHETSFDPQGWMVESVLEKINAA